jgi:hypothetical protein
MTDQWELINITTGNQVSYYTPTTYRTWSTATSFITNKYPNIKLSEVTSEYGELMRHLLKDGWEPFAVSQNHGGYEDVYSFRRKVE